MSKIKALFRSRRFGAVVGGILVVVFQQGLGLSESDAIKIVGLIMSWVIGDSLNKTV